MSEATVDFQPPERFNIAEYFLDDRVREGRGNRTAIRTVDGELSYREVQALANRWGNALRELGVEEEQRVLIALPDGPDYVGALFGAFKIGAAAVMVNPFLRADEIGYFLDYTRAKVAVVHRETEPAFREGAAGASYPKATVVVGTEAHRSWIEAASPELENFPTHRDDAALWLFSGGTTGRPKAVVQSHASYANTTECYAKRVVGYAEDDVTLSVPKLYFGYATGANLFFPFAAGASTVLFPERCTPETLFDMIERFRPTILVNVPTMVQQMTAAPDATARDLSSLRLATSAGEALPETLYHRWRDSFGVELLDGLGTAEMWHIFLSNRPDDVRPGTLGRPVPGFEIRLRDFEGRDVGPGEVGFLWVKGGSRAIGYWQQMEKTARAFRGPWYVSEDMLSRDEDGYFTYAGRADDMLKVSGKWLSPKEVENCLLTHPAVEEAAVVGTEDENGLIVPFAYVEAAGRTDGLEEDIRAHLRARLAGYKMPRQIVFMEALPRTHLGKINRGELRRTRG